MTECPTIDAEDWTYMVADSPLGIDADAFVSTRDNAVGNLASICPIRPFAYESYADAAADCHGRRVADSYSLPIVTADVGSAINAVYTSTAAEFEEVHKNYLLLVPRSNKPQVLDVHTATESG